MGWAKFIDVSSSLKKMLLSSMRAFLLLLTDPFLAFISLAQLSLELKNKGDGKSGRRSRSTSSPRAYRSPEVRHGRLAASPPRSRAQRSPSASPTSKASRRRQPSSLSPDYPKRRHSPLSRFVAQLYTALIIVAIEMLHCCERFFGMVEKIWISSGCPNYLLVGYLRPLFENAFGSIAW